MSMRYLIRRANPEDLSEIRKHVPNLDEQLGDASLLTGAQEGLRRPIDIRFSPTRAIQYSIFSKKTGEKHVWTCPSLELVAENEPELREMAKEYGVEDLSHLAV
jgi:hypothetical protein